MVILFALICRRSRYISNALSTPIPNKKTCLTKAMKVNAIVLFFVVIINCLLLGAHVCNALQRNCNWYYLWVNIHTRSILADGQTMSHDRDASTHCRGWFVGGPKSESACFLDVSGFNWFCIGYFWYTSTCIDDFHTCRAYALYSTCNLDYSAIHITSPECKN